MPLLALYITGFIACSALIIFSGSRLSRYGDIIADLSGMGKAWFGLIMMSAVTSLPELFTAVGSIVLIDTPDIAIGNIYGSCAFNLLILAILDYFIRGKPLTSTIAKSHALAGFLGILLVSFSVLAITFPRQLPVTGWFSSASVILIILYLVSVRIIYKNEQQQNSGQPSSGNQQKDKGISLRKAIARYSMHALLIIAAALTMPYIADHLAVEAGLSKSFVGTLLVAASTSLPELVVAIAAVRIGSADIAVGNLLGSNLFNILILALNDLMYTRGNLFTTGSDSHALSGLFVLVMTAVTGAAIMFNSTSKRFPLSADAVVLIILYCTLMLASYAIT